jgi:hypothetical protein
MRQLFYLPLSITKDSYNNGKAIHEITRTEVSFVPFRVSSWIAFLPHHPLPPLIAKAFSSAY